jgi:hypothetical protein
LKRLNACRLIVSVVLMGVILGMTFFQLDQGSPVAAEMLVSSSMAALVQSESRFNRTAAPGGDYGECFIVPRNLGTALNYSFSEKQSLPVWGNVTTTKQRNNSGFFFAAMVLLLFSRFYQRSRTSSEDDGDPSPDFSKTSGLYRVYA